MTSEAISRLAPRILDLPGGKFVSLLLGPAKVNEVKIFSEAYYMIKHVLTFVSGVLESVLVDFISQNKIKILCKVKTCRNCLHQKFPNPNPYKNEKKLTFFLEFLSCY